VALQQYFKPSIPCFEHRDNITHYLATAGASIQVTNLTEVSIRFKSFWHLS